MLVPTLQLFNMVRYHHPMLHIVLHGTPMHFHCGELVFPQIKAVPLYRQPFQNESATVVMLACKMCVYSCTFTPHLMVTFTSTRHVQSNYTLHFLSCYIFWWGGLAWFWECHRYVIWDEGCITKKLVNKIWVVVCKAHKL
jgi:hypothetical protein